MKLTAKLLLATGSMTAAMALTALGGCGATNDTEDPGTTTGVGGNPCPVGQLFCEGECTVVDIDPDHCGQCGRRCGPDQVCSAGQCGSDCTGGTTKCGDVCVNTDTDQQNCGSCGNACPAGQVCDGSGSCVLSCPPEQTECGGACVNTDTNNSHCGQCNHPCTSPQVCNGAGECDATCQSGWVLCGTTCINPLRDPDFCGASGDCAGANAGEQCGQAEVCDEGSCEAVTCNDQWEQSPGSNDTEASATVLEADPMSDCADAVDRSGVLNGGSDVDWYRYEGEDNLYPCVVNPTQLFDNASSAARLCAFFECVDPQATTVFTCPESTTQATSPQGRFGCCQTSSTADFTIDDMNCTGTWSEDVYVYIRVDDPSGTAGTCTSYVLQYSY